MQQAAEKYASLLNDPLPVINSQYYSVASAVDSDCSRTAPGHCYGSTQQLQQRQVSKRLPTAVHPRNAARNDVRV